jgi:hypothetical protein
MSGGDETGSSDAFLKKGCRVDTLVCLDGQYVSDSGRRLGPGRRWA